MKAFQQEILNCLGEHRARVPDLQQQDIVKFIFQAMLGPGHLLAGKDRIITTIVQEMDTLQPDRDEQLLERLSPDWCRLNLRRAMAEHHSPQMIAGFMMDSGDTLPFSRQDVYSFCVDLSESDQPLLPDRQALEMIMNEDWLPSHSPSYRKQYHPAYRVISASWAPCMEAVCAIAGRLSCTERLLVTIDGPCASGKTTLAQKLAGVFRAAVIHTDDFVIPHARKTAERLALPGGNCDANRIVREILAPWKNGNPVRYRRYDCKQDCLLPEETLADHSLLILEGCYSNLPAIRAFAGIRLFLNISEETRMARLRKRESPESFRRFENTWIPLENAYFGAFRLPDCSDDMFCIQT